jgi:O-acetyl-ADP-ribose deacetylase (regulator of RNase III)
VSKSGDQARGVAAKRLVLLMISYTQGNLLKAETEAIVNTVNTVGVMGKGIALMFKEAFPDNFKAYQAACKSGQLRVGKIFAFRRDNLLGPKWVINFPTKDHWRNDSKIEWIVDGLRDLRSFILSNNIKSIAIPPLGAGNGKLDWHAVKHVIEQELTQLKDVHVVVFEPVTKYQNVAKRHGVEKLTPARAIIVELIRRYSALGLECTILEVQKLAYFMEKMLIIVGHDNPLRLEFKADKFGPYAPKLTHLLESLDGSFLHCQKRLTDASPLDMIWFDAKKETKISTYLLAAEFKSYWAALDATTKMIDGFQSPLGMELLATVDWLIQNDCKAELPSIKLALSEWPGGARAAQRKAKLFDDRLLELAITRIVSFSREHELPSRTSGK